MPTGYIRAALSEGVNPEKIQQAGKLAAIGVADSLDKMKKQIKDNADGGFGGFKGFDGFGSGYWSTKKEKEERKKNKENEGKRNRIGPEAVTFGMEKVRRRLMVKEQNVDIYGYGEMENERKCMVLKEKGVYEVCVGFDFVEIKKFIKREDRLVRKERNEAAYADLVDSEFMRYIGFEYAKYREMMKGMVEKKKNDKDYTHYLDVYEFVYDEGMNEEFNEQCFVYLEPFRICLSVNNENEMMLEIEDEDMEENEKGNKYIFNFSNDHEWNEIDEIIGDDEQIVSVKKCVRLFQIKMCLNGTNDSKFKVLLYKTQ